MVNVPLEVESISLNQKDKRLLRKYEEDIRGAAEEAREGFRKMAEAFISREKRLYREKWDRSPRIFRVCLAMAADMPTGSLIQACSWKSPLEGTSWKNSTARPIFARSGHFERP